MPTASTSQILGFNECIEPITSNIYSRRTLAGSFMLVNRRLMRDCMKLGIWSESLKNEIIKYDGSIQEIKSIPKSLRDVYKTVWDIKQKVLINLACDRGRYICQSQSLNLYLSKIDMNTLGSMHLYGWVQGLKTGLYYLRIKPVAKTQQFTVEPASTIVPTVKNIPKEEPKEEKEIVCRREAGCTTCSA
jgi:ribonucleoside-diphosphate reductase alpha chain